MSEDLTELLKILNEMKAEVLIHPLSIEELNRDKDSQRRDVIKSKLGTYSQLDSYPKPSDSDRFISDVNQGLSSNDQIDNTILFSVYKNAVDFLITEDKGIHRKGRHIGLDDRIFLIKDALDTFKSYIKKDKVIAPPALSEVPVYQLNYADPILQTLKEDYKEFEGWFKKISKPGRKCWVHLREDKSIGALLIYKVEDEPIECNPPLPKKPRIKISTFIVTHIGHKIGELFIKLSVDVALKNNLGEIYLTHFTKNDDKLIELITEYGFIKVGVNTRGEEVYLKELFLTRKEDGKLEPLALSKKLYPSFYDGQGVNKYIVPITPDFHSNLFTDYPLRQTTLTEHSGGFIVEGNTIKKAYLSHSKIKKIRSGDILLFYRSKDFRALTSLGVVEKIYSDVIESSDIMKIVGKRTVFSREEIEQMEKPLTIFLFRHHLHMKKPIEYPVLISNGIISGPPQSISEIDDKGYEAIKSLGEVDGRFTIN